MVDFGKPNQNHDVFVESTDTEELRAQRVWRFVFVLWITWIFFAGFLSFRNYEAAAQICVLDSLAIFLINLVQWRDRDHRRVMNLNLTASAVGLFAVSVSDPAMRSTILFYPISILVASQLIGVRAAFSYFVINLLGFTAFFFWIYGMDASLHTTRFDEFVLVIGVASCVFFCCQQGEDYYEQRTANLIRLSQDLQQKSETLHELATTDALTGLINRFQFQERLKDVVNAVNRDSSRSAKDSNQSSNAILFLIDMDGFKEINDTLGHVVGDQALMAIARRLEREFGDRADIARLGGDEFCIIYQNLHDLEQTELIARRLLNLLTQRYVVDNTEFPLGASIGYAICPNDSTSDSNLLAFADTAMFHAKENQLGWASYSSQMTDRLVEYRSMQEKLSRALERDEFFLEYQPQVNLQTNRVIGVEALLRWRSEGEVISPVRFIPLLERSREIIPVSNWIIRNACKQLRIWNDKGFQVEISINVSALQFNDPDFIQCISDSVHESGINANQLDFEITEGLLIDDVETAVNKLQEIKALGATISIDDFGTGYSSLAYLRQFPLDRLKIDRAFIKDIPDQDDGVIASSIIVLAKALGLKVLAEGVETQDHVDFLKYHDCDEYQGYLLSPPVGPNQVEAFFPSVEQPPHSLMQSQHNGARWATK